MNETQTGEARPGTNAGGQKPLAIFLSQHLLISPRRAGMYWLADAYRRAGWKVVFATVSVGALSIPMKDYRVTSVPPKDRNKVIWLDEDQGYYLWVPPFHPANLRNGVLNHISSALFPLYHKQAMPGLSDLMPQAQQILIECGCGVLLAPSLKKKYPGAKLIYRVSDDLSVVGAHPSLVTMERKIAPVFDRVSLPSARLQSVFDHGSNLVVQRHGLAKGVFDSEMESPYDEGSVNVVSVGSMLFDDKVAYLAAKNRPDWNFHFFGDMKNLPDLPNVIDHGERPFAELAPYIKFASIGAAFYQHRVGAEYLADTSNKMIQYAYCKVPIVAPDFVTETNSWVCGYEIGNTQSLLAALDKALGDDPYQNVECPVDSWDDVARSVMSF